MTSSRRTPTPVQRRSLVTTALLWMLGCAAALSVAATLLAVFAVMIAIPQLPSLEAVTDYQPKVPMRIFTADHVLIGEFGEERRIIVRGDEIPVMMKQAVLAIEDDRFYQHGGIDYIGVVRAGIANVIKGGNAQGASTITMQVARNFFLSSEKTYTRKIYEVLLAYKIERALSKEEILELYINQIYLGQRAYGFGSAASVYFDKALKDISLAEAAMLAGLPKAPSAYNPVSNFKRAQMRQHTILKRMLDLGYIQQAQFDEAKQAPTKIRAPGAQFTVHAEYVAETARQLMIAQYPDDAYTRGLNVVTTIYAGDQQAAYEAVQKGVLSYEKRFANRDATEPPQVEGAFVALVPQHGAIRALVGGYDFDKSKFNHVTQAWRQPGSVFKPFIYSAALETGIGPATVIDDAPLYFTAAQTGSAAWAPKNYGGRFAGPITMRTALMKSKNLVTIRIMQAIGASYAQDYVTRFGFDAEKHPAYLPMALGAGQVTPLQVAIGYAVFANGGFRVNPYLIQEVSDSNGNVLSRAAPLIAGFNAIRVLDARNDYIMNSMLNDVMRHGSAAGTNVLKRNDLAGKTGTTNDSHDAWFAGYHASLAAVSWIGYDQPRSLGSRATGSGVAMPIWIDYMAHALKNVADVEKAKPAGVELVNGEMYMDDRMPGAGFVPSVDLPEQEPEVDAVGHTERQGVLAAFAEKHAIF